MNGTEYYIEAHLTYTLNNSDKSTRWFSPIILQPLSDKIKRGCVRYRTARQYIIYSAVWFTSLHLVSKTLGRFHQVVTLEDLLFTDNRETFAFRLKALACLLWTIPCLRKISTSISRARVYKYEISQSNYLSALLPWHCTRELKTERKRKTHSREKSIHRKSVYSNRSE